MAVTDESVARKIEEIISLRARIEELVEKAGDVQTLGRLDAQTELEGLRDIFVSALGMMQEMADYIVDIDKRLGELEEKQ